MKFIVSAFWRKFTYLDESKEEIEKFLMIPCWGLVFEIPV
jgi:hypothetical protein